MNKKSIIYKTSKLGTIHKGNELNITIGKVLVEVVVFYGIYIKRFFSYYKKGEVDG